MCVSVSVENVLFILIHVTDPDLLETNKLMDCATAVNAAQYFPVYIRYIGNSVKRAQDTEKQQFELHHISHMFNEPEEPSKSSIQSKSQKRSILDFYFTCSPHYRTRHGSIVQDTTAALLPRCSPSQSPRPKKNPLKFL